MTMPEEIYINGKNVLIKIRFITISFGFTNLSD
jgi:hypothetical protein